MPARWNKIIGVALIISPFLPFYALGCWKIGFLKSSLTFAIAAFFIGCIVLGVHLLNKP